MPTVDPWPQRHALTHGNDTPANGLRSEHAAAVSEADHSSPNGDGLRVSQITSPAGSEYPTFLVEYEPTNGGERYSVQFANGTRSGKQVPLFRDRALVVGTTSAAQMVTVVDLNGRKVLDQFRGQSASVSPTGRWIAFEHHRPSSPEKGGAVYGVYDARLPPSRNRLAPGAETGETDVGIPVYPDRQRRTKIWDGDDDATAYGRMSPIVWTSENVIAILDRSERKVSLVTITMRSGDESPLVRNAALDLSAVLDYSILASDVDDFRLPLAESIAEVSGDPGLFVVGFIQLQELRVRSTKVRVW